MSKLTFRQRLLLIMLVPSALMAVILVTFFTISSLRALDLELTERGRSMARYLAPISEYGILSGQVDSLHVLAQSAVQEPGVKAAVIVNQKGRVIAVSGRVSLSSENLRKLPGKAGMITNTDNWVAFGAPVMRSLSTNDDLFDPLSSTSQSSSEAIGAVFIEFHKSPLEDAQRSIIFRSLAIIIIGLLLLALTAIAIAENAARPVRRLVVAVRAMAEGKFDTRIATTATNELGYLERGFNEMAAHIENVHQSLHERIEEATVELAYQAQHDALTGLINRREFEQRLEGTLANTQASGEECSVLFIDLDRFKPVNDTVGHLAGDELLRQIARLFQGRLRDEDTLARVGGDEFCILLNNCTSSRARQVADDICALTAAYRFIWQDKIFAIGASIGLTRVNRQVRNITDILSAGDAACYRAKESGRNQVVEQAASSGAGERRQENGAWGERINRAIADHHILIEALPLRALQANAPTGQAVEISAFLSEPGQRRVSLPALMDAAERNNLATMLDRYFIDQAIEALARAAESGKSLHCLVPISLSSLRQRDTVSYIDEQLTRCKASGDRLMLLISEEETTQHASQALEFCQALRAIGCKIALDDFGGSLSSFSHLRAIAPDYIKLSRSLTRDLSGNRASTALLRAIQEITADLGISSIAVGVDSANTIAELTAIGITYAEGPAIAPREPLNVWLEGAVMRNQS